MRVSQGCDEFRIRIRIQRNPALFQKSDGYLKSDCVGFEIANCGLKFSELPTAKIIQCISTTVDFIILQQK